MENNHKYRKRSIRTNMLLLLSVALFIFAVSAGFISYQVYLDSSVKEHTRLGIGAAKLVADSVDAERVNEFLEKGESAEGYLEAKDRLELIRDRLPNIKYVYVYKIWEDGCHVVFDLDADELEGSAVGSVQEFDDSFMEYIPTLLAGGTIDPIISDDSYGWLLTIYTPVYDSNGLCQCYAAVDVSMDELRGQAQEYVLKLATIFFILFAVILLAGYQLAKYSLILPINKMEQAAEKFAYNSDEDMEQNLSEFRNLKIQTGDEIENLYHAFVKMTEDSVKYMQDLKNKNSTISKMQNTLILTLADLVESRDENTGHHIRKTAAYVRIILEEMKRQGIYKDQLSDKFIDNVINSAPLHDIGKIAVPDSILNKPGKLTKEEFEIMKSHTSKGGKIIESIIKMIPDSHYLDEAKNLATYHHERWDGKGYPSGLIGEHIPLSARIMAVADVFDALVSKRSYKEGFPFDKAMNIIIEEKGTHFDPQLVDVFVSAEEQVKKVAKAFGELS